LLPILQFVCRATAGRQVRLVVLWKLKKNKKIMLICTVVYGLGEYGALRSTLHALRDENPRVYSIKLEAFNPYDPRLNDTVGQAINLLKSWFRQ